jgi:hypothetical protein
MYMLYFFMNVLFFHQVLSFVVNHRSYGYFLSDVGEPPEQTAIQDTRLLILPRLWTQSV